MKTPEFIETICRPLEEWRIVKDFPYYWVSSHGRVVSMRCSRRTSGLPIIVKPGIGGAGARGELRNGMKRGYFTVALYADKQVTASGKRVLSCNLSRLVLDAFEPSEDPNRQVVHKDGDAFNVALSNLKWGTQLEAEALKQDRGVTEKGEGRYNAKLTDDDVRAIRASTETLREISAKYGVATGILSEIRSRKRWKHVV